MEAVEIVQRDLVELFPQIEEPEEEIILLMLVEEVAATASADLRRSLEDRGQLMPVLVNAPEDARQPFRVIDGRRRIAALRASGATDVMARVYRVDPLVESALAATANAVRSANPENELEAIERLAEAGFDDAQIARATGLRVQTIRKRRRLEVLPVDVREGIRSGKVAVGIADRIVKLPPSQRERLVAHYRDTGKITGPDIASVSQVTRAEAVTDLADLFEIGEADAPAEDPEEIMRRDMAAVAARFTIGKTEFARLAREGWELARA